MKKISYLILFLLVLFLVLFNFVSHKVFDFARIDLTENKLFSLSEGSDKIIKNIDEPILLKFYFSKKLAKDNPYLISFASRVEEFLRQYTKKSKKIKLQVIEPEEFSEEEDEAMKFGLQGAPISNDGRELYFGLIGTNSTVGKEVISFFHPNRESYLEYDITQLLYKLNQVDSSNKIGVISSLPIQGEVGYQYLGSNQSKPWAIWEQLKQQYNPVILENGITEITKDIKLLMLVNINKLSEHTIKAINDFVLTGGKLLLFIDPLSELNRGYDPETSPDAVSINKLLTAWGVDYDNSKVLASRTLAKNVRYMQDGKEMVGLYPLWLDLNQTHFNKRDIVTAELAKLTIATPGVIERSDHMDSKTGFTPLISVHQDVMMVNKEDIAEYKSDPNKLLRNYNAEHNSKHLAVRINGKINSAFDDRSINNSNIIIMADSDMLYDHFWVNTQSFLGSQLMIPTSGNGNFVLNSVDSLFGSDALVSIRNKEHYSRSFDKVHEIEIKSQQKFKDLENSLLIKIDQVKDNLRSLEKNNKNNLLNYQTEEEKFKKDLLVTRAELRKVRKQLNHDIESLEAKIKFFGIIFIPLLIIILSCMYYIRGFRKSVANT